MIAYTHSIVFVFQGFLHTYSKDSLIRIPRIPSYVFQMIALMMILMIKRATATATLLDLDNLLDLEILIDSEHFLDFGHLLDFDYLLHLEHLLDEATSPWDPFPFRPIRLGANSTWGLFFFCLERHGKSTSAPLEVALLRHFYHPCSSAHDDAHTLEKKKREKHSGKVVVGCCV